MELVISWLMAVAAAAAVVVVPHVEDEHYWELAH